MCVCVWGGGGAVNLSGDLTHKLWHVALTRKPNGRHSVFQAVRTQRPLPLTFLSPAFFRAALLLFNRSKSDGERTPHYIAMANGRTPHGDGSFRFFFFFFLTMYFAPSLLSRSLLAPVALN